MSEPRGKPQVLLLMGPTGAGKTDLAIELAARYPIEIVSVDSAMVYRGMDVGTGKPSAEVLRVVPHHLIDILDPTQTYSAGQFVRDVQRLVAEILAKRRIPVLVGGTMLYFRALTRGLAELPVANAQLRAQLNEEANAIGWPAMHARLANIDPVAAVRIQPNDAQRIQRALEVFALAGRTLTELHASTKAPLEVEFVQVAWGPSQRELLYERIETRFDLMLQHGFVEEVQRLYRRGDLHADLPSIRSVGYRQLWDHVAGKYALQEARRLGVLATRHLARRQLIWLRAMTNVDWLDSLDPRSFSSMQERMEQILARTAF